LFAKTIDRGARAAVRFIAAGLVILTAALLAAPAAAEVVRVEISSREVVSDAPEHARSGPYEVIIGVIHFEVDPDNPANGRIVDLLLAPRNDRGRVEFSADFELHKPVDPNRGNRRLLYFVNNRGRKIGSFHFNTEMGRDWLYSEGWSYLWCGWNVDVFEDDDRFNIRVPVVTDNGKTITGTIYNEILSYANEPVPSMPLVWGGSIAYPAADLDNSTATLTRRKYRWEEPVIEVPRDQWAFARFEDGEVIPDPRSLYVEGGIEQGWLYDLVYIGKDPKVTGLGMAAIRDIVAFFRFEKADRAGLANPLVGFVDHAYAWGHSQSGRLLNHFVYQDFNRDEKGRKVFDGLIANCPGGGKGLFNSRFAQITRHGSHLEDLLYPIDFFPFTTVEQHDPVTGEDGDSFALARESGSLPKMFFVNTTTDYWTRAASLLHTDTEGTRDLAIDPEARIYFVAGRTHIDARVGIIGRALLVAMDEWVSDDVDPPESVVPRIADGTLVDLDAYLEAFPDIPDVLVPSSFYRPYRLDMGPRWKSQGIADNAPPKIGPTFGTRVPQVDAIGNEIAGIKLPEVAAPIATFTGWRMRNPAYSESLGRNRGSILPLPNNDDAREKNGDPRPSVEELYPTQADYMLEVTKNLIDLHRKRLLLGEDLARLLGEMGSQAPLIYEMRPVGELAAEEGANAAIAFIEKLREAGVTSLYGEELRRLELNNNSLGYRLMFAGDLEGAKEVFKLNILIAPESANAWDSLGECYLNMLKYEHAKRAYERSLELDPDNNNARRMLERIRKESHGDTAKP
jgi:hypothetical protein